MRRVRHLPGEAGIWVLVFVDLVIFASLFLVYAYSRVRPMTPGAPDLSELDRTLGLINTAILLTSSWLVAMGIAAIRNAQVETARSLTLGALILALGFIGVKIFEYTEKLNSGKFPSSSEWLNFYFSITGLHLFHVLVGVCVLAWMRARMAAVTNDRHLRHLESGAVYWHMVDLLWIVIFPLIYLL